MNTLQDTFERSAAGTKNRRSNPAATRYDSNYNYQTLIDQFLVEQRTLTAVDKFARHHDQNGASRINLYRDLIPLRSPQAGEQYAFTVDLDKCSGCKACVSACHSLNGLDDDEVWRTVGLLTSDSSARAVQVGDCSSNGMQQHITTACHHCVEPACLEGCPVLAYDKDPVTGIVRHLDDQCIGCNYCVMKCPYEVPKYSSRLGIVRKCDMCADRLAVGEAPACAQACPSAAIQITLVKPAGIESQFRHAPTSGREENTFLPDSPDPRITLPTTQFISKRGVPANLFSADRAVPRLDEAHWPLVLMLLLTQSAAGMFLAAGIAILSGVTTGIHSLLLAAYTAFLAGLGASVLHLGQPLRAWRCFLGWRKSWLSREVIVFNLFTAVATPVALVALNETHPQSWLAPVVGTLQNGFNSLTAIAICLGLIAVFASAMVYVDVKRPFWIPRRVFGNFFGATFVLGTAFSAIVLGLSGASLPVAQGAIAIALVCHAALFVWRQIEFAAALRDSQSPIHLNARVIRELLPWTTRTTVFLFAGTIISGALAMGNIAHAAPVWIIAAALGISSSEIIARHVFFAASAGKRMPGGVGA